MRDDERTALGSPPLARGAPRRRPRRRGRRGITPARAGSTRWVAPLRCSSGDHPRSRGEHLDVARARAAIRGSPPLARGAPRHRHAAWLRDGITPARAGSTFTSSSVISWNGDHPRSRGEHSGFSGVHLVAKGSPPLARGARPGSTRVRRRPRDHPRSRGEHPHGRAAGEASGGSPPLARGAPVRGVEGREEAGITPARAGSTDRLHGAHAARMGSPPLARGAPWASRVGARGAGITPARAGSTTTSSPEKRGSRDHPRSRGEHMPQIIAAIVTVGSPPLARGALTNTC